MEYEFIGYVAALCTTAAYVPQALKTVWTRDTRSISLGMYVLMSVGVACWLAYGVVLNSWPIVAANAVTLVLTLTILGMKLRFG